MRKKEESGNGLILSTYEQNKHDANSTIKELSCCRRYKSKVLRSVVSRLNCPKRSEPHSFGRAGVNGSVTGPEAQNPKLVAQKPHHLNPPQSAACTCPLWCKQVFAPVSLVRRWASKGPPFHHPNLCSRPSCVLVSFAISCIFPSVVLVVSVPEAACVFFFVWRAPSHSPPVEQGRRHCTSNQERDSTDTQRAISPALVQPSSQPVPTPRIIPLRTPYLARSSPLCCQSFVFREQIRKVHAASSIAPDNANHLFETSLPTVIAAAPDQRLLERPAIEEPSVFEPGQRRSSRLLRQRPAQPTPWSMQHRRSTMCNNSTSAPAAAPGHPPPRDPPCSRRSA